MHKFVTLLILLSGLVLLLVSGQIAYAQQVAGGWSAPVNLSDSDTNSNNPSIAVDPSGVVHVVWSEETGDGRTFITYSRFEGGQWSPANEIISSPVDEIADSSSMVADSQGYLHLVWRGGSNLYYSRAYAPEAGTAQSWSPPQALEYTQANIGTPYLAIDRQDVIHLVYSLGLGNGAGIYYIQSADGGMNWSDPVTVFRNARSDRTIDGQNLAAGPDGTLYMTWTEYNYPETFPPIGISFASSRDGGQTWSEPISLADGPYRDSRIAVVGDQEVHVVWSGTQPDRFKFHTWSRDGGNNWEDTWKNTEVGGFQGWPALVTDGSGKLHWLMVGTVYAIGNDSLVHSQWLGDGWSPVEVVLMNKISSQNPANSSAAVVLGDELFSVVQYPEASTKSPDGWQYEIYGVHRRLEANHLPAQALATQVPTLTPRPSADQSLGELPVTSVPTINPVRNTNPANNFSLVTIIVCSSIAGALIIPVLVIGRRRRQ